MSLRSLLSFVALAAVGCAEMEPAPAASRLALGAASIQVSGYLLPAHQAASHTMAANLFSIQGHWEGQSISDDGNSHFDHDTRFDLFQPMVQTGDVAGSGEYFYPFYNITCESELVFDAVNGNTLTFRDVTTTPVNCMDGWVTITHVPGTQQADVRWFSEENVETAGDTTGLVHREF